MSAVPGWSPPSSFPNRSFWDCSPSIPSLVAGADMSGAVIPRPFTLRNIPASMPRHPYYPFLRPQWSSVLPVPYPVGPFSVYNGIDDSSR